MAQEVTFDESGQRDVLTVDGEEAGFAAFAELGPDLLDFNHTVVYEKFKGQGLSKPLIKGALDDVRARHWEALATCSAVEAFISKNPEYEDVLAS